MTLGCRKTFNIISVNSEHDQRSAQKLVNHEDTYPSLSQLYAHLFTSCVYYILVIPVCALKIFNALKHNQSEKRVYYSYYKLIPSKYIYNKWHTPRHHTHSPKGEWKRIISYAFYYKKHKDKGEFSVYPKSIRNNFLVSND